MKKLSLMLTTGVLTVLLFISFSSITNAQDKPAASNQRPVFRMPPRIISPELLPDNKVTFRLYSKDAVKVTVSGEWQQGYGVSEMMEKNDTGLFSITVGPLKPELYGYNFNVDGVTVIDPSNVQVRRDGVRYQSFFIVPGAESDLYFQKDGVPHGTVTKQWYHSATLNMDRRVYI